LNNRVINLPSLITYSNSKTSTITSVSPQFGPSIGGSLVTLTGTNFGTNLTVTIDQITCSIVSQNSTSISCITGIRLQPPANGNSFVVTSDTNPVIIKSSPYLYLDRWSSQATWGGEALPREGDTVYVPPGMSLLVDVSTPILKGIFVEGGTVIFADETDLTVDA
jgi:hypothetical protein